VWADPAWHLYVVRTKHRELLQEKLEAAGVGTQVHYPIPPHLQKAYSAEARGNFPLANVLADEVLSLPMGPHLTKSDVEIVTKLINEII
jgi:dTDP-4-amino-4,6-dideoxygalactose transaminase